MRTSTTQHAAVSKGARLLLDAFRRARRNTTREQDDEYMRNLIKRVESERSDLARVIIELLYDAHRRGAPREDVEHPLRVALAIVASWYEAAPNPDKLHDLIRRETLRQAAADIAELDLSRDRSPHAIAEASEYIDAHLVAIEDVSAELHELAVTA